MSREARRAVVTTLTIAGLLSLDRGCDHAWMPAPLTVVSKLDPDKAAKLASFEAAAGPRTWQESVSASFGVDGGCVKGVYGLCRECGRDEAQSIAFILNGFGYPRTEDVLRDLAGCMK